MSNKEDLIFSFKVMLCIIFFLIMGISFFGCFISAIYNLINKEIILFIFNFMIMVCIIFVFVYWIIKIEL